MALNVSIPKEITDYKTKLFGGLQTRKLVCLAAAIVVGAGTYFLCAKMLSLSSSDSGTVVMVAAAPLLAIGFIEKDGLPLERYAVLYLRHRLGTQKLAYSAEVVSYTAAEDEQKERKDVHVRNLKKKTKKLRETDTGSGAGFYRSSRKERQRKCAAARVGIEAARKEFLAAKKAQRKRRDGSA